MLADRYDKEQAELTEKIEQYEREGRAEHDQLDTLKMKETGADVHAIGDGGFAGCTSPENIHQLSVSIKGRPYTYFRMASTNI